MKKKYKKFILLMPLAYGMKEEGEEYEPNNFVYSQYPEIKKPIIEKRPKVIEKYPEVQVEIVDSFSKPEYAIQRSDFDAVAEREILFLKNNNLIRTAENLDKNLKNQKESNMLHSLIVLTNILYAIILNISLYFNQYMKNINEKNIDFISFIIINSFFIFKFLLNILYFYYRNKIFFLQDIYITENKIYTFKKDKTIEIINNPLFTMLIKFKYNLFSYLYYLCDILTMIYYFCVFISLVESKSNIMSFLTCFNDLNQLKYENTTILSLIITVCVIFLTLFFVEFQHPSKNFWKNEESLKEIYSLYFSNNK